MEDIYTEGTHTMEADHTTVTQTRLQDTVDTVGAARITIWIVDHIDGSGKLQRPVDQRGIEDA